MDARAAVRRRLGANGLAGPPRADPVEVVRHLLAVQSQDVQPSAWSTAQRTAGGTEDGVERVRAEGRVVRTHVLRTTWHDVCAEDLRWLLDLTGPRVLAASARARRELGLDDEVLAVARSALDTALPGRHLTRAQVAAVLGGAGLHPDGRALSHLLMALELQGQLCSGARSGRTQTYALLDERVPPAAPVDHDEAVTLLVRRFLAGHGPATAQDLAWWASLKVSEIRTALRELGDAVRRDPVDDLELWSPADAVEPAQVPEVALVHLYDEHLVAFTSSKRLSDPRRATTTGTRPWLGVVLAEGVFAGSWGRTERSRDVTVTVQLDDPVPSPALDRAVQAYGAFLGRPAVLRLTSARRPHERSSA